MLAKLLSGATVPLMDKLRELSLSKFEKNEVKDGGLWDKLTNLANKSGIDIINGGNTLDNAFSVGGDVKDGFNTIETPDGTTIAKAGDIIFGGDKYKKDFILAHELGHTVNTLSKNKLYKALVRASRTVNKLNDAVPEVLSRSELKGSQKALIAGLAAAANVPKVYEEISASNTGKDLLKSLGADDATANQAFTSVPSYIVKDIGQNALLAGISGLMG